MLLSENVIPTFMFSINVTITGTRKIIHLTTLLLSVIDKISELVLSESELSLIRSEQSASLLFSDPPWYIRPWLSNIDSLVGWFVIKGTFCLAEKESKVKKKWNMAAWLCIYVRRGTLGTPFRFFPPFLRSI
jgi:hypothetical protein